MTQEQTMETSILYSNDNEKVPINKKIEEADKENTRNFILITPDKLKKLIKENGEQEIFVYFGRVTCSWCRNFVPLINKEKPSNLDIYYIDTEDTDKHPQIKSIRKEYEVPSFIKITGNTYLKFDRENEDLHSFFSN